MDRNQNVKMKLLVGQHFSNALRMCRTGDSRTLKMSSQTSSRRYPILIIKQLLLSTKIKIKIYNFSKMILKTLELKDFFYLPAFVNTWYYILFSKTFFIVSQKFTHSFVLFLYTNNYLTNPLFIPTCQLCLLLYIFLLNISLKHVCSVLYCIKNNFGREAL